MKSSKVHSMDIRVRFCETDTARRVHFSVFFVYFEDGFVEIFRNSGLTFEESAKRGLGFPIVECKGKFISPARFDELIQVETWFSDISRRSLTTSHRVLRKNDKKLLAEGYVTRVCTGPDGRATELPNDLLQNIQPLFRE